MSLYILTCKTSKQNVSLIGTGAMVAAVTTAAGRQPVVLGKPSRFMFEIVQKRPHPTINMTPTGANAIAASEQQKDGGR